MMAMLRSLLLLFVIFSVGNAEINLLEKCPFGWTNYGLRCYKFFSQAVNFVTAERNCQSLEANLASSHNKPENDFLLSLLPSTSTRSWIGAHDAEIDGQWLLTDGSTFDYSHWCPGEPNNPGIEECTEVNYPNDLCWNNLPCTYQIGYICATDL